MSHLFCMGLVAVVVALYMPLAYSSAAKHECMRRVVFDDPDLKFDTATKLRDGRLMAVASSHKSGLVLLLQRDEYGGFTEFSAHRHQPFPGK